MNKLAVIAFTLLVFFSTMLWYLANGSLNEYLKSQILIQGQYYSGQKTTLELADFSDKSGITKFNGITLANADHYQIKNALIIDEVSVELSRQQNQALLTEVKKITINKLTLNVEHKGDSNNIDQLIEKITLKLAKDYPQLYPKISAELYANNYPDLDAEAYAKKHPQAGPIIEHIDKKKSRGKPQQRIKISAIYIKNVEINTMELGVTKTSFKNNIHIAASPKHDSLMLNQIGGEILLYLLNIK